MIACTLPHQPGPQPSELNDIDFKPGHNIIGILRLDGDNSSSFVYVERAYKTTEIKNNFSPLIRDANVTVEIDSLSYSFLFVEDPLRGNLYVNPEFSPLPQKVYSLTVSSPGLPDLIAKTIIPSKPLVIDGSLAISNNQVNFSISTSPEIETYDIFIFSSSDKFNIRLNNNNPVLKVQFNLDNLQGNPQKIEIFGYESNLTLYLSSTVVIKPQAYHETVTTVNGGYGCFGALSKTVLIL